MRKFLLATTNSDKIREIRALMDGADVEIVGLDSWGGTSAPSSLGGTSAPSLRTFRPTVIEPPEETGTTFAENARLKARYYATVSGMTAIAEDSGLEIDALDGAPGVESARFGGAGSSYPEKFAKLYAMLDARGGRDSAARFVCAVAVADGEDIAFEARGTVEGRIAPSPRGAHGFGYDPIFFYPPENQTLAEVSDEVKRAVSHRGAAFRAFRDWAEREEGS